MTNQRVADFSQFLINHDSIRILLFLKSYLFYKPFLILLLLAFSPGIMQHTHAQSGVILGEIGTADGLSYRWVFDLLQDENGFIWISTYDGLNRYDGTEFKIFRHDSNEKHSIGGNRTRSMMVDSHNRLWISIEAGPPNYYDPETNKFVSIDLDQDDPDGPYGKESDIFFEDKDQQLWIGFKASESNYVLYKLKGSDKFSDPIELNEGIQGLRKISEDDSGNLWLWTLNNGYIKLNKATLELEYFPISDTKNKALPIKENNIFYYPQLHSGNRGQFAELSLPSLPNNDEWNNYSIDDQFNIWLHTDQSRIYRARANTNQLEFIIQLDFNLKPNGSDVPPQNLTFLVDRENTIWIGHFFGISKVVKPLSLFENYLNGSKTKLGMPIDGFSARAIIETKSNKVFLRDQPGNLFYLDQEEISGKKVEPKPAFGLEDDSFNGFGLHYGSDDKLWIGLTDGVVSMDENGGNQIYYEVPDTLGPGLITDICEDSQKRLWLSRREGNIIFNLRSKTFSESPLPQFSLHYCHCSDDRDIIWSGHEKGLLKINTTDLSHQYFPLFQEARVGGEILSILPKGDHLWLAGYQGLIKFNKNTGEALPFSSDDGLPSDIIYSVLEDGDELWLGTHAGLTRFNPLTSEITTFYEEQGLSHNEFNRSSYLKTSDGKMFFGGLNGVNAFYPASLAEVATPSLKLHLMQVEKYNGSDAKYESLHWHDLLDIDRLVISPNEKDLSFYFALTSLSKPKYNQYFYKLVGLDTEWKSTGNVARAQYNRIPPGDYVLRAKANDSHGSPAQNEIELHVHVKRAWHSQWWAYMIYAIVLISILALYNQFQFKRKVEKEESKRLKELDSLKTKLYTNITHEFRTPLTVILGMTESIRENLNKNTYPKVGQAISLIKRNGQNLLNLVNQMLDLSKMDTGGMKLNYTQSDIIEYIKRISSEFSTWAEQNDIDLHFISMEDKLLMDFDREKLHQVITNLFTNAIKFTPTNGNIYLTIAQKNESILTISIRDTGSGIPPESLSYIFDRFYQVNSEITRTEGSGVGLALTKELVTLMKGQIDVKSKMTEGTEFIISLPISNVAPLQQISLSPYDRPDIETSKVEINYSLDQNAVEKDFPIVLIIEDNEDLKHLIKVTLQKNYQLLIASDGMEGRDIAFGEVPDIIISDVMMPNMDGYELCRILKSDDRTSHIPILLLTARADQESKILGFKHGADAYLTKPFEGQELIIRLENFLRLREKMQLAHRMLSERKNTELTTDERFLLKARQYIIDQLSDESLSTVQLSRALHLSRAQLHRKITALTGFSTSHFIRDIRLTEAKKLLFDKEITISEVGYRVGFKSPSHFSRAFKTEFGIAPQKFRESS